MPCATFGTTRPVTRHFYRAIVGFVNNLPTRAPLAVACLGCTPRPVFLILRLMTLQDDVLHATLSDDLALYRAWLTDALPRWCKGCFFVNLFHSGGLVQGGLSVHLGPSSLLLTVLAVTTSRRVAVNPIARRGPRLALVRVEAALWDAFIIGAAPRGRVTSGPFASALCPSGRTS